MNNWCNPSDESIAHLLQVAKTIAVVGCSPKPDRTSYRIAEYLLKQGYHVIPVHPQADTILGQKVYPTLTDIPEPVDIVNVFRRPEFTPPIAKAAVAIKPKVLWLQLGIASEETYKIATGGGLICIMDKCIAVAHRQLVREAQP